jgi:hypothetical protein
MNVGIEAVRPQSDATEQHRRAKHRSTAKVQSDNRSVDRDDTVVPFTIPIEEGGISPSHLPRFGAIT